MKAKVVSTIYPKRLKLQEEIPLRTPWVIYVEPSGYCNLKCKFCPQGVSGATFKRDLMTLELFKKSMDDLLAFPDKVKLLRFCGNGESLCNKNIVEMLRYAREKNVTNRIELVSNGILLNASLARDLPRFLDRIIISIEGLSREDYQSTSNTDVNFQDFLKQLDDLYANRGNCVVHIKIHCDAITSEDKKAAFFKMFSNRCDEIDIENLVPLWPQYNENTVHSASQFRWGGEVVKRGVCVQIFKGMQIQADGEVVPCCVDWNRTNVIGDVNRDSVLDIWNSDKLNKLQMEHLAGNKNKLLPCMNCRANDFCDVDNIDASAKECAQRMRDKRLKI